MRRSVVKVLLILPFSVFCVFASQDPRDPNALQLGASISQTIGPRQSHRFAVVLEKNYAAQVVVDQRGIDLIVRVFSPDRRLLGEFDSPSGANGAENVKVVATAAGTYSVEVAPFPNSQGGSGRFEIRLTEVRPAIEPELQIARRPEVLKAKSVALLARLTEILPELRGPHTRIRYQVQLAQLLWPIDEKAARKIAMDAATGVREFIERDVPPDAGHNERFYLPTQMRQEVFHMLVPLDPDFALVFLQVTRTPDIQASRNPGQPDPEIQFELHAATNIASKDPKRAFQIAQETLGRGYSAQLSGVISTLRTSEPHLASRLMKEAVTKLQDEKLMAAPDAANLAMALLRIARSPAPGRPTASRGIAIQDAPLLSPVDYRNLFAKTLEEALSVEFFPDTYSPESNAARNVLSSIKGLAEDLRSIAPGMAGAIDEKLALMNVPRNGRDRVYQDAINNSPPEIALDAVAQAPPDLRDGLYFQIATRIANTDPGRARQIATSFIVNAQQRWNALDNIERQAVSNAINSGKLEEAMTAIRNVKSRRERANLISQMTYRVSDGSHKADAALRVLEEARALLTTSFRVEDQQTMSALLQVAGALSRLDVQRGFHIVEPFIDQFNDMVTAAGALDGFGHQYFQDGELALNNGNPVGYMANQLTQALAKLSTADFDRAKNVADRIQRPEVRAALYLAMAQQGINAPPAPMMVGGVRIVTR